MDMYPQRLKAAYALYGLSIDDSTNKGMAELQEELESYEEWAKQKLAGSRPSVPEGI